MEHRTTVRLDESLLAQAKREAHRRGASLTSLIDEGLRLVLAQRPPTVKRRRISLPVSTTSGGTLPGVDLDDSAALEDRMANSAIGVR